MKLEAEEQERREIEAQLEIDKENIRQLKEKVLADRNEKLRIQALKDAEIEEARKLKDAYHQMKLRIFHFLLHV